MSELSEAQQDHVHCFMLLIQFGESLGYKFTWGDAYRDERVHGKWGVKKSYSLSKSTHKIRLAVDINLWIDGEWITDGTREEWSILGKYWKSLHPLARWGGDFDDANHFSFEMWGSK